MVTIELCDQPTAPGHMVVYPNAPVTLEQLSHEQAAYLQTATSIASSMLFELVHPHGTNIIMENGAHAQMQTNSEQSDRVTLHIIPRFSEDNLGLLWQPKQGDPNEIKQTSQSIQSHMVFGDVSEGPQIISAQESTIPQNEPTANTAKEKKTNILDDLRVQDLLHRY